jgi:hypothetical protein
MISLKESYPLVEAAESPTHAVEAPAIVCYVRDMRHLSWKPLA